MEDKSIIAGELPIPAEKMYPANFEQFKELYSAGNFKLSSFNFKILSTELGLTPSGL